MSTPQVNPQEVFRATLPLGTSQIVIFVPSLDREGKPIVHVRLRLDPPLVSFEPEPEVKAEPTRRPVR